MTPEGLQPLAFHSRIDGTDRKRFRDNVGCLSPGTWLTPVREAKRARGFSEISLSDPAGDPVGYLMAQSAESIVPRMDAGWAVRVLAHQRYLLRDSEGDPDPDKVGFTLMVFTYPPGQEANMAPQLAHAQELLRTTNVSYKIDAKRAAGLLAVTLTPENKPLDLTGQAAGCAGALVALSALALAVVLTLACLI